MLTALLLCTASNLGGMQRVVCALARGLAATGIEVRILFPDSPRRSDLLAWCRRQGVEADTHPALRDAAEPHSFETARSLRRLIREVDPGIVHLHYGDNFLSFWDLAGVRAAGLSRNVIVSVHGTSASRRKRVMTAVGARAADAVTAFAYAPASSLREAGVPDRRLHVIPCGIAPPDTSISRASARRALGLTDDVLVVGTMARLVESKAVDLVIEAMDCEPLSGAVLLVGGDGPARAQLETLASTRRFVDARFLGHVDDVGGFFAACDVFTLPSRQEGFGLVFVEAAQYGVPSVATRVGGIPDAVCDSETGVLVERDDLGALRAALVDLLSDEARRRCLGAAARERALAEFSEENMVERFIGLYQRCGFGEPVVPQSP
jgi:glycosyltransferase involved in cell wall biosynthesis